ncbi:MAG: hypothetical protein FJZ57_08760, partial [Chlamydiae bacterium]|nr:hypothetical protein [Chlamydiota bacterium]
MSQITQITVDSLNLPKVLDLDTFVSRCSTAKKGLRVLTDPEKDTLKTLFRESILSINQYDTDSKPLKNRLKTLALNMLTTSSDYCRTTQGIGKDFALDLLQQLYKIKNGVHLEIAFFSSIYDLIGFNKKLFDKVNSSSSIPFRIFDDILTIIPNLCNAITLNETHTEIHINIRELFADFERTDVNDNSHDFDQVMLTHMSQFTLDENTLQVPIKNIPDEVSINNLRENPDPKIKLIGQLFLLCHLYKEKITDLKHNLIIAETILGKLDTTLRVEPGSPPQKIFDEYTPIRNYIPLLFSIIDQRTELNSRGLPLNQLLFLPDRCSQIIDYAGTKWKEELASFYGLILTIENIAKKILTPTDKNESIATENHLSRPDIKKMHTQLAFFYAQSWSLPSLNQAGFCETADGFYDLTCKFSFDAEKIKAIKSPSQASPTDSAG